MFIGSDKGLVSYKGEATKGKDDYSDVYAYPNPVRPEYRDKVTITGLMDNSIVKITDLNGNLVYQTKSLGGQVIWNCRNTKGVQCCLHGVIWCSLATGRFKRKCS